jgi:glycosyltransferase involved in cell wall biosynthesis
MTVLVDVTQFSRQPARSGVQRALCEMARAWPVDDDALFVARIDGGIRALTAADFAALVDAYFSASGAAGAPERVQSSFAAGRTISRHVADAAAWLLPEPTYDTEVLADLRRRSAAGQRVSAIVFDCFPQTHPWAFAGNGHAQTSPYFRLLARLPLVIATSDAVQATLVGRLRRDPEATPVALLGTDHVPQRASSGRVQVGRFLMVGTIEPRKRIDLGLDAIALLRKSGVDAELVVVGRAGWAEPALLSRLRRLAAAGEGVTWRDDADDALLMDVMATAAALLALGDEGFGLPVVEALKQGCPVIFMGEQPAARLAEGRGATPVAGRDPEALADALAVWCEPGYARARREEIDLTGFPTWHRFAMGVTAQVAV